MSGSFKSRVKCLMRSRLRRRSTSHSPPRGSGMTSSTAASAKDSARPAQPSSYPKSTTSVAMTTINMVAHLGTSSLLSSPISETIDDKCSCSFVETSQETMLKECSSSRDDFTVEIPYLGDQSEKLDDLEARSSSMLDTPNSLSFAGLSPIAQFFENYKTSSVEHTRTVENSRDLSLNGHLKDLKDEDGSKTCCSVDFDDNTEWANDFESPCKSKASDVFEPKCDSIVVNKNCVESSSVDEAANAIINVDPLSDKDADVSVTVNADICTPVNKDVAVERSCPCLFENTRELIGQCKATPTKEDQTNIVGCAFSIDKNNVDSSVNEDTCTKVNDDLAAESYSLFENTSELIEKSNVDTCDISTAENNIDSSYLSAAENIIGSCTLSTAETHVDSCTRSADKNKVDSCAIPADHQTNIDVCACSTYKNTFDTCDLSAAENNVDSCAHSVGNNIDSSVGNHSDSSALSVGNNIESCALSDDRNDVDSCAVSEDINNVGSCVLSDVRSNVGSSTQNGNIESDDADLKSVVADNIGELPDYHLKDLVNNTEMRACDDKYDRHDVKVGESGATNITCKIDIKTPKEVLTTGYSCNENDNIFGDNESARQMGTSSQVKNDTETMQINGDLGAAADDGGKDNNDDRNAERVVIDTGVELCEDALELSDDVTSDVIGLVDAFKLHELHQEAKVKESELNRSIRKYKKKDVKTAALLQHINQLSAETEEIKRLHKRTDQANKCLIDEVRDMKSAMTALCDMTLASARSESKAHRLEPMCYRRYINIQTQDDVSKVLIAIRNRQKALADLELLVYRKHLMLKNALSCQPDVPEKQSKRKAAKRKMPEADPTCDTRTSGEGREGRARSGRNGRVHDVTGVSGGRSVVLEIVSAAVEAARNEESADKPAPRWSQASQDRQQARGGSTGTGGRTSADGGASVPLGVFGSSLAGRWSIALPQPRTTATIDDVISIDVSDNDIDDIDVGSDTDVTPTVSFTPSEKWT